MENEDRIFDHDNDDIHIACGMTELEQKRFEKKLTEWKEAKHKTISEEIEYLYKHFTKLELALFTFSVVRIRNPLHALMKLMLRED